MKLKVFVLVAAMSVCCSGLMAQHNSELNLNKPEREEWFTDLGLGLFIHWSFDVQLGMVISHSAVGATQE